MLEITSKDSKKMDETGLNIAECSVELMGITSGAEDIIERACRTCYLSFHRYDPPNSTGELITKVIRKRHHSVLEHAIATFRIKGGSRVFTHELVRHRFISPSQESQRYVCYADKPNRKKTKDFEVVLPGTIKSAKWDVNGTTPAEEFEKAALVCYELYERMLDIGVPPEDARYILPNATVSEIVITANFRELRHFFCVRTNPRAHWEIRRIAIEMLKIMKVESPIVFGDFEINEEEMSATFQYET